MYFIHIFVMYNKITYLLVFNHKFGQQKTGALKRHRLLSFGNACLGYFNLSLNTFLNLSILGFTTNWQYPWLGLSL